MKEYQIEITKLKYQITKLKYQASNNYVVFKSDSKGYYIN